MNCPRCGIECDDTAEACFSCGWVFASGATGFRSRLRRLAPVPKIWGLFFVILLFILPVLVAVLYILWRMDAGPVPNEFAEADLVSVRPENEITWSILCKLNDSKDDPNGAPAMGLTRDDVDLTETIWGEMLQFDSTQNAFEFVLQRKDDIEHLWNQSAKGRSIIEELCPYDQIADLSKPRLEEQLLYSGNIRLLLQINTLHSLILFGSSRDVEACSQLIIYDSFFRKHSSFARSIIAKLTCYSAFEKNITTAAMIACHPDLSDEALLLMHSHFRLLTKEQMSLKNGFIHEYLMFKNAMNDNFGALNNRLYKQNSVCRYYNSFCRNWMLLDNGETPYDYCPVSVWPWEHPLFPKMSLDLDQATEHFFDLYFFYNPIGSAQMKIMLPALTRIIDIKTKVLIEDDLLQWILARRMGQEGSLKARAYSEEYTVDIEKEIVFSVGPDGEPYTDDDIKMNINPEVLNMGSLDYEPQS